MLLLKEKQIKKLFLYNTDKGNLNVIYKNKEIKNITTYNLGTMIDYPINEKEFLRIKKIHQVTITKHTYLTGIINYEILTK